jgi:hypothetical protein
MSRFERPESIVTVNSNVSISLQIGANVNPSASVWVHAMAESLPGYPVYQDSALVDTVPALSLVTVPMANTWVPAGPDTVHFTAWVSCAGDANPADDTIAMDVAVLLDLIPPELSSTALADTMDLTGPYPVAVQVTDNYGVDTSQVRLHFYRQGEAEDSVTLVKTAADSFSGHMTFAGYGMLNQRVYYYVTAGDLSHNRGTSSLYSFNQKDSLFFESFPDTIFNPAVWDTGVGWRARSGAGNLTNFAMSQRANNYPNNFNNPLTYLVPRDFRPYTGMKLHFFQRRYLASGDTCFVEATRDNGATWARLKFYTGNQTAWGQDTLAALDAFCGTGNDNDSIRIRFRIKSDAATTAIGWMIDDFRFKATGPYLGVAGDAPAAVVPQRLALLPAYPNPMSGKTTIRMQLPSSQRVSVEVYNVIGQRVRTLCNAVLPAGTHSVVWDGADERGKQVSNGVYLYQLRAGAAKLTRKLIIVR